MKIAILTSGRLPVPATKGGAVETKLDYILDYNAQHHIFDITTFSVIPDIKINKNTKDNHYIHFSLSSLSSKIQRKIYKFFNSSPYYDEVIEFFLYKCIRHIKKDHYDCIIIANRPGFVLKFTRLMDTKIILQINNDYLNINTPKAREIKERCSLIIACSNYLNERASKIPCIQEIPVKTVHNGIDIKRFVDAEPIPRHSLRLSQEDFVVFFSGRLTEEKGILELIRSIKGIREIPKIKLVIAGASFYGNDDKATPYINKLRKEAEEIKDKVLFTGFINYKHIPSYLKMADVIVVPSLWEEPFGLTVLEAMASGVPLIASRCGGIPEICEGVSLLIDRKNICKEIKESIIFIYNNPEEAKYMANMAQKRSWEFDKESFSKNYLQTISKILSDECL